MAEFRFRVEAALEDRRKKEEAAAAQMATAEAALRAILARREDAVLRRQRAADEEQDARRQGTTLAGLEWHRNWIAGLSASVERLALEVEAHARVARQAERAWKVARKRRLVLERLRARAWRRYQETQHRLELKAIDELARLRHTMPGGLIGRTNRDD